MSIEEALAIFPSLEELKVTDQRQRAFIGKHRAEESYLTLVLSFEDTGLVSVGIYLKQISDCEKIRDGLSKSLGPSKTMPVANGLYQYDWITDRDVVTLKQLMPSSKLPEQCAVYYLDRRLSDKYKKTIR